MFFKRCCSTLFPYYDVIQTTDLLHRAPTETQSFWTFSPSPLSVCNNSPSSTPLLPPPWWRSPSMEFGRRVRHIIKAQSMQWEGPFRVGSDGRGATWRGHAWLASPWQPSVFARWSIEGPCRPFCHGLCRHCFPRCRALTIYPPRLARSLAPRLSR